MLILFVLTLIVLKGVGVLKNCLINYLAVDDAKTSTLRVLTTEKEVIEGEESFDFIFHSSEEIAARLRAENEKKHNLKILHKHLLGSVNNQVA